jgi:hypothetical protein
MVPTPANLPKDHSADIPIDLFSAARRLQRVRMACRRFMLLWAMSPPKVRQDLALENALNNEADNAPDATSDEAEALLRAISDPSNRDWSLLYRGSVLDD